MANNAWIRDKVVVRAIATLALCLAVGWLAGNSGSVSQPQAAVKPTPEMLRVIVPTPTPFEPEPADWSKPQHVPAPTMADFEVEIIPPVLPIQAEFDDNAPTLLSDTSNGTNLNTTVATLPPNSEPIDTIKDSSQSPGSNLDVATFDLLGAQVQPGQLVRTTWGAGEALHGAQIPTPVLVAHGLNPGPTMCVTAAVHGDELNGIEAVRRFMYSIKPDKLRGTVIGVPIVNLQGFSRHSRYLSDRRDLNRFFPGNPKGSSAARMAHSFFNNIVNRCDGLVDLHTGSFHRTNLPQLRADLKNTDVVDLTHGFGSTVILHSTGSDGTLRRAAVDAGIPAVTMEAGEPLRLEEDAVEHTVKALFTLLDTLKMYNKRSFWGNPEPAYYSSAWIRADQGGLLLSQVKLGRKVKVGDILGTVTDPISNEEVTITAPYPGRVIGMALNQYVMPGYATYHLANTAELDELPEEEHFHAEGIDVAISDNLGSDESE